jgi:pimeloyl-ACP methyl ester carboxylesterase
MFGAASGWENDVRKIQLSPRRLYQRAAMIAGLVAVAGLVVAGVSAASASSSRPSGNAGGPLPTVVLEHGAWANSASWNGVVQRLQADGYTVDVPPNPLQGLAYDPAYLADFLHTITGPIILVGHSYGGAVITNAATGNPQVKALSTWTPSYQTRTRPSRNSSHRCPAPAS